MRNVWQDLKENQKANSFFIPFLLLLVTIPFPLGVNNIALAILGLFFLLNLKKIVFKKSITLLTSIVLFLWISLSFFWSIDKERTLKAIPKEIVLFIIPLLSLFLPFFSQTIKDKILKYYSFSIVILAIVFVSRALVRYILTDDSRAFFYHGEYEDDYGLVPKLLNAIHVSVYTTLAFFYFFTKTVKSKIDYFSSAFLFVFMLLLASKNIILVFIFLVFTYVFFFTKVSHKVRFRSASIIVLGVIMLLSFSRIRERFLVEFQSNTDKGLSEDITTINTEGVHVVSIYEAWNNEKFSFGDYFPGTAFRVYQVRMFFELLKEESIFWKGFGLNASISKLQEKEKKYNLYPGYGNLNFHNQYIQNFAELGFIGFLLLIIMLALSIYYAINAKDFMYIAFTILMISLFLTESFLWRQRGVVFFSTFYCLFAISTTTKNTR